MGANIKISVNKLGEYIIAKPTRRLTIIKNQKRDMPYLKAYYAQAEEVLIQALMDHQPKSLIQEGINNIVYAPPKTSWEETRQAVCVEALDYASDFFSESDFSDLNNYIRKRGGNKQPKLIISNLQISVRPEILLYQEDTVVGAIKLIFSKNHTPDKEETEYIATILHQYIQREYTCECKYKNCYVLDVFRGELVQAPRAYKNRMKEVEAACLEIVDTWERV